MFSIVKEINREDLSDTNVGFDWSNKKDHFYSTFQIFFFTYKIY